MSFFRLTTERLRSQRHKLPLLSSVVISVISVKTLPAQIYLHSTGLDSINPKQEIIQISRDGDAYGNEHFNQFMTKGILTSP